MEEIKVTGLVVREADYGEYDKMLTVVTHEYGKVSICAKGVKSQKSKHIPTSQTFTYNTYILKRYNKFLYIVDSEQKEAFFGLREDLASLSLAAYIGDICADMSPESSTELPPPDSDDPLLRLTLNAFYALSQRLYSPQKIKASYELKACALGGFCPDLVACCRCGKYENTDMYLDIMNGCIVCAGCRARYEREKLLEEDASANIIVRITPPVLEAMRHIAYADQKKMLSFSLTPECLDELSYVCEKYLLNQFEHGFYSLDFYKKTME